MNKIEKVKLENGLIIYLYEDKRRYSTFINLVTKFGGIHHDFILNGKTYHIPSGTAHFLEHYLLEHTVYGNIMHIFGKMHLSANGMTSINKTEYYFSGVTNIEKALDMLIKAIHNITFKVEEIEETKKAIYEEIRMGDDSKGRRLFKLQNESLFYKIPYKNTIGTKEDVDKIDISLVRACYKAFYRPENEYIFIAGNFEKEKIKEKIISCYKKIPFQKESIILEKYKEPIKVKKEKASTIMQTAEDIISINYKIDTTKRKPKDRVKLDFYLSYFLKMNAGRESNLCKKLEQNNIIIGKVIPDHLFLEDMCIISLKATVKDEQKYIEEITKQMKNPLFKEDLFQTYQKDSTLEIALRKENPEKVILPFIENIFTFSYEKEDTVKQIKNYTFEDFKKEIKKISFNDFSICKIKKPHL